MQDVHLVDIRAEPVIDGGAAGVEVLLSGWAAGAADALSVELRARGLSARTVSASTAAAEATRGEAAVLAVGPELPPAAALELLRAVAHADAHGAWVCVALGSGDQPEIFQELVDQDRLFFLARHPPSAADTAGLLFAAAMRAARQEPAQDDGETEMQARLLDLLRRLGRATGVDAAIGDLTREMRVAADATHAQLWLYDDRTETLTADARRESAVAGITSYAARTGRTMAVERAGDDPRYDADVDTGDPRERFLACPLLLSARVLGVLTLRRDADARPFSGAERERVESSMSLLASALGRLILERELEARTAERHTAIREDVAQLFRGEALDHYQRGRPDEAHLLEVEPRWTQYTYRVVLALVAAALLVGYFVRAALRGFGD